MSIKYVQSNTLYLAGSGVIIGATSIILTSFADIYGNVLTMTDFGAKGYITLEPDTTNEEGATFTGVVANANGTYTLTGVSTILAKSPYTETSGLVRGHSGGTKVVVTDNVAFWNTFANKANDEAVTGLWSFTQTPTGINPGAVPDASTTTKGIAKASVAPASPTSPIFVGDNDGRVPTQGENDALVGNNTDIAVGTGNKFVTQTGFQKAAEIYAATATGNDTYVVTLSPVLISYSNGMVIRFKADVANTGTASLNVNGLGPITLNKSFNQTLVTGDILANQIVEVVYNSTGPVFQIQSQIASPPVTVDVQSFTSVGAATWTKPAGALSVFVQAWGAGGSGGGASVDSAAGGGGGGGAYTEYLFRASDLGATESISVGTGGTGTTGDGAVGGNTTFSSTVIAYGGGGGAGGGTGSVSRAGGGGGGGLSVGSSVTSTTGGTGGEPLGATAATSNSGFGGAGGGSGGGGGSSAYGGAGGGGQTNGPTGGDGGSSIYGGGGGAGGGTSTAGAGGASKHAGAGGNGGAVNAVGVAGSSPAGGGGGASRVTTTSRAGGAGGNGQVIVTTFF